MFGAWDLHRFYFINMQIGDCFSTKRVFQIAPCMSRAMEIHGYGNATCCQEYQAHETRIE